jgi:hypothetical protein
MLTPVAVWCAVEEKNEERERKKDFEWVFVGNVGMTPGWPSKKYAALTEQHNRNQNYYSRIMKAYGMNPILKEFGCSYDCRPESRGYWQQPQHLTLSTAE